MRAITLWLCICAYLNCTGWTLSALHQLNAGGYTVALALGLAGWLAWWRRSQATIFPEFRWQKLRRRFWRSFPRAFLTLAFMTFLGGVLYAPSNYDALAYRIPRVLHWLDAGRWHWIHTIFSRLNQRACGIEWVSAPVIALTHSTRPLFLINFIPFLLLPGLVFSLCARLGVRPRVAWHWMWLAPTGYCYLLQAASIGNDLFGAFFALAAVLFAVRAGVSRTQHDFFASVLAAALMTSAKPSNLPLMLPWALAMVPSVASVFRWPLRVALLAVFATAASFLPTALLNAHYCGDWTGVKVEVGAWVGHASPFFLIAANMVLLGLTNFNPPICPFAGWWDDFYPRHLSADLSAKLSQTMEGGVHTYRLIEMQMEESAGLGFGICLLLAVSLAAVWLVRSRTSGRRLPSTVGGNPSLWLQVVRWSPVASLLVVLAHSVYVALGREITPYYALLLPLLLAPAGHTWLINCGWWRRLAGLVFIMAGLLLVLAPPRPLFPVLTILHHLHHVPARIQTIYEVYRARPHGFAPAVDELPPDVRVLGFLGYDDPETSLWEPFGSRRVEHVRPEDTAAALKDRGIHYVLMRTSTVEKWFRMPLETWLHEHAAQIIKTIPLTLRASDGPVDWYLIKLD